MTLSALEGFYWVGREGGYTAAAQSMPYGISQPAVYKQVRKLERELGTKLVEKAAHGRVVMTPAGERLHAFCAPFFAELPLVEQEIRHGDTLGRLRIDTSSGVLKGALTDVLRGVSKLSSNLEISVHEHNHVDFNRLASGKSDIVVDYVDVVPKGLVSWVVASSAPFLIAPESSRAMTPKALRGATFVAYDRALPHYAIQQSGLLRLGFEPGRLIYASSADSIVSMVSGGLGFSIVPWFDARGPVGRSVRIRKVGNKSDRYSIHAVCRKTMSDSKALQTFLSQFPETSI